MTTLNYNIRGISPELMSELKRESKQLKISINLLILNLIEQGIGFSNKPKRMKHHDLDFLFGTWSEKETKDFEKRTKVFEKIDENLWR